jgi:hypothetical protein
MYSSGPELDLDLLTMRKEEVAVPKVIHTLMFYCGDNCKLVKCNVHGYNYGRRFFIGVSYAHDPIKAFGNVRPKLRSYYISQLFIIHCCFIIHLPK